MRAIIILAVTAAALAGPAAAEFGRKPSPSGFQAPKPTTGATPYVSSYGAPGAPSAPKPRTYGTPPAADTFKPYEPYKSQPGTSLYGPDGKKKR